MIDITVILISIINIIIFFASFSGKNQQKLIYKYFYLFYIANSIGVYSYAISKILPNHIVITLLLFSTQISVVTIFILTKIYIKGEKVNKKTNIFYIIPFIYLILASLSIFIPSMINKKTLYFIYSIIDLIFIMYSFATILISMLNKPYEFSKPSMLYTLSLLIMIVLLLGPLTRISYLYGFLEPLIFSLYVPIIYITLIKNENIDNIKISLASEFDLIPSSVVLIDENGKLLEYNKKYLKTHKMFTKDDANFFNYFSFITETLGQEGLNEFKFHLKEVIRTRETTSYIKRFLYRKKYYTYTIDISPVLHRKTTTFIVVLTEGEHLLLLDSKEDTLLASKFETLGELADSVISEINIPISSIKTNLSILKTDKVISKEDIEILDMIDSSASKINILTTSMRNHFRNSSHFKKESFDLSDLIISIESLTKTEFKNANCNLILDIPDSLIIYGIPSKLSQVLINILNNSLKAYKDLGKIDYSNKNKIILKASVTEKYVTIIIKDFAGGISKNIQPHIFNNILTTKGADGFGLGLYVSNNIIKEDFNGEITFNVNENVSTAFKIKIPLYVK